MVWNAHGLTADIILLGNVTIRSLMILTTAHIIESALTNQATRERLRGCRLFGNAKDPIPLITEVGHRLS